MAGPGPNAFHDFKQSDMTSEMVNTREKGDLLPLFRELVVRECPTPIKVLVSHRHGLRLALNILSNIKYIGMKTINGYSLGWQLCLPPPV